MLSRRDFVALSSLSFLPGLSRASIFNQSMLKRIIPSSGEEIPVIGLGTSRVFDIEPAEDEVQSVSAPNAEPQAQADNDPSPAVQGAPLEAPVDSLMDEFTDLDAVSEQSAVDVKLDLATTYIEMGDAEGAREILEELIEDSTEASDDEGQKRARVLLESL